MVLDIHIRNEEVSWLATADLETTGKEKRVAVLRRTIVGGGRITLRKRPITLRGLPGREGNVIPRGRLAALMKAVTDSEEMYALCWAVLRRYALERRRFPDPPHSIRQQAYQVIERAWVRAGVDQWLRNLPTDFWSAELPPSADVKLELPGAEELPVDTAWPMAQEVVLDLHGQGSIRIRLVKPLDELLDPRTVL